MNTPYTDNLIPAIKSAEDFSPVAYLDTLGNPTIGYGHKLAFPLTISLTAQNLVTPLSEADADTLLIADLTEAANLAANLFPNHCVPSVRTDVLIEMAFILGGAINGLPSWRKLIKAARADKPREVAWEILNSRAYWQIPRRLLTLALRYLTRTY